MTAALASVVALAGPARAAGELRVEVDGGGPLADLTRLARGPRGGTLTDGPASDRLVVGELPRTGLPLGSLAALGALLVLAGWVGLVAVRRRWLRW